MKDTYTASGECVSCVFHCWHHEHRMGDYKKGFNLLKENDGMMQGGGKFWENKSNEKSQSTLALVVYQESIFK